MSRKFRIHGDNVVECERTLQLLAEGLGQKPKLLSGSSPLHPEFEYKLGNGETYIFELLPGHGRWGIDISKGLVTAGSQLRENADSVIFFKSISFPLMWFNIPSNATKKLEEDPKPVYAGRSELTENSQPGLIFSSSSATRNGRC